MTPKGRANHIESQRRYRHSAHGRATAQAYYQQYAQSATGRAAHLRAVLSYNGRHPERVRARILAKEEIRLGRLVRQPCELCGDPKTHAHHDDYSKPLDVRWLCRKCHKEHHAHALTTA